MFVKTPSDLSIVGTMVEEIEILYKSKTHSFLGTKNELQDI